MPVAPCKLAANRSPGLSCSIGRVFTVGSNRFSSPMFSIKAASVSTLYPSEADAASGSCSKGMSELTSALMRTLSGSSKVVAPSTTAGSYLPALCETPVIA